MLKPPFRKPSSRSTHRAPAGYHPRYNVAPSQEVLAIVAEEGVERPAMLRWGLIPFWAKDAAIGSKLVNARAESIAEKPAFRNAFRKRRCLILADGFYEWRRDENGKVPLWFHRPGDELCAFARDTGIVIGDFDELGQPRALHGSVDRGRPHAEHLERPAHEPPTRVRREDGSHERRRLVARCTAQWARSTSGTASRLIGENLRQTTTRQLDQAVGSDTGEVVLGDQNAVSLERSRGRSAYLVCERRDPSDVPWRVAVALRPRRRTPRRRPCRGDRGRRGGA